LQPAQGFIQAVRYANNSAGGLKCLVAFALRLAQAFTTTVSAVEAANNASSDPVLSGIPATGTIGVYLAPSVTVTDAGSTTLEGATVTISGGTYANDGYILTATTTGNITQSYDPTTETLTLSGTDTLANYQTVLQSVTLTTSSNNPTNMGANPSRTVTWTVDDGTNSSSPASTTVSIDMGLDSRGPIKTLAQAQAIQADGYQFVVRYLGSKNHGYLTAKEASLLTQAGLGIVSVYEKKQMADDVNGHYSNLYIDYFSTKKEKGETVAYNNGYQDAEHAYKAAMNAGQPFGSVIYFGIDLDEYKDSKTDPSLPAGLQQYFQGVNAFFNSLPEAKRYAVGVYGDPGTVSLIEGGGLATYSWLGTSWTDPDNNSVQQAGKWNIWQPATVSPNTFNLSLPGGSILVDTDYANVLQPLSSWNADPPSPSSTNVSAQSPALLVQSIASLGTTQNGGTVISDVQPAVGWRPGKWLELVATQSPAT
jgi:hypothetical protein